MKRYPKNSDWFWLGLLLALLVIAVVISGCANMTPGEKKAAAIAGAVIVGGIVASQDSGKKDGTDCFIVVTANGSDHVCR